VQANSPDRVQPFGLTEQANSGKVSLPFMARQDAVGLAPIKIIREDQISILSITSPPYIVMIFPLLRSLRST